MSRRMLAVLLSLLYLSPASFGWNNFGHMSVGYVAYQHLALQTRARADKLIRLNPSYSAWKKQLPSGLSTEQQNLMLFMIAATWPDQIRSDKSYHSDGTGGGNVPPVNGGSENIGYTDKALHKYWHFMDTPFTQDGTLVEPSPSPNAETQIKAFARALASKEKDGIKSYDLVWLLHMVGDIHQPLHSTSRFTKDLPHGDSGGNLVELNPPPCQDDRSAKVLHSLWDGALGNSNNPQDAITAAQALPPQQVAADDMDVDVWMGESVLLSQTKVYAAPVGDGKGPFTIDQAYCTQMRTIAEQRVEQAGLRLANLLNTYLK